MGPPRKATLSDLMGPRWKPPGLRLCHPPEKSFEIDVKERNMGPPGKAVLSDQWAPDENPQDCDFVILQKNLSKSMFIKDKMGPPRKATLSDQVGPKWKSQGCFVILRKIFQNRCLLKIKWDLPGRRLCPINGPDVKISWMVVLSSSRKIFQNRCLWKIKWDLPGWRLCPIRWAPSESPRGVLSSSRKSFEIDVYER